MSPTDPKDPHLIIKMAEDPQMAHAAQDFFLKSCDYRYSYNFTWLGVPIIQYPQDIVAMQEIVWRIRPDLIVETGVAHGGSAIFYASLLEMLGGDGRVVAVDVDIRVHNRAVIESHPLFRRVTLVEGSSVDQEIIRRVYELAAHRKRVLVVLDSNHTHEHVSKELGLYSPLVKQGSYLVVFDTIVEDMPDACFPNRPWSKGNNPKTAVQEFLRSNSRFEVDREIEHKLLVTVAPGGYLKCLKN